MNGTEQIMLSRGHLRRTLFQLLVANNEDPRIQRLPPCCTHSHILLAGFLASFVICLGSIHPALAQGPQTDRGVENVSLSLAAVDKTSSASARIPASELVTIEAPSLRDCITKPTAQTPVDRWVRFEEQYGIDQPSPSAVKRTIQTAKYTLDKLCFSALETARKLEFTYDIGHESPTSLGSGTAQPPYSLPLFGRFGHAQLKSKVTFHDPHTGQAFIGLMLTIPFGPGQGGSEISRHALFRGEGAS